MARWRKVGEHRGAKILKKPSKYYYLVKFPNNQTAVFSSKREAKVFINRADKERFNLEEREKKVKLPMTASKTYWSSQ